MTLRTYTTLFAAACMAIAVWIVIDVSRAYAQRAPGWQETGGWACKSGAVRVIVSNDGLNSINFYIAGAWFNNNYTLRGNMLYYNGELCQPFGRPFFDNFRPSGANVSAKGGSANAPIEDECEDETLPCPPNGGKP